MQIRASCYLHTYFRSFTPSMEVRGWECLPGNKHHMLGLCIMTIITCMVRCSHKLGTQDPSIWTVCTAACPTNWSRSQLVLAAIGQCVLVKGPLSEYNSKARGEAPPLLVLVGRFFYWACWVEQKKKLRVYTKLNSPWHPLIKLAFY